MPTNGFIVFDFLEMGTSTGFADAIPLKIIGSNGRSLSLRNVTAQADTIIRANHPFGYAVTDWEVVVDIPGRHVTYRPLRVNTMPQLPGARWGSMSGYRPYPQYTAPNAGRYDHLFHRGPRFGRTGRR